MAIIFLIFGLIVGSFLNVVVYRLRTVETLWGRSHCPSCRKKIRWHDNIPLVSFLLLSARCRDCGDKISLIYPATELLTGIVFALVGTYFFSLENPQTYVPATFYLAVFSVMIIIFIYDLKYMEIPMLVLWVGVGISFAFLLFSDWNAAASIESAFSLNIFSGVLAGFLAFIFFFSMAYFSKETWMGYGDAYLGLLAGLVVGWPAILWTLVFSFTIGAIFGIALVFSKKKTMKSQVPFAPFLITGVLLTVILPAAFKGLGELMLLL